MSLSEINQDIYNLAIYSEYHHNEFSKYISNEKNKIVNDLGMLERHLVQLCNELKTRLLKGLDNASTRMGNLLQEFKGDVTGIN